jgi:hypothetical protein
MNQFLQAVQAHKTEKLAAVGLHDSASTCQQHALLSVLQRNMQEQNVADSAAGA